MSYYRIQQENHPIEWLLDPEYQFSTSWNAGEDVRSGVSVCGSLEELATYFATVGIPFTDDCLLVELDGTWSDDEDEDAHLGAMLVYPTEIISTERVGARFGAMVIDAYDTLAD